MKNKFFNHSVANIYLKPSYNSEVVSQILYGEKFKILSKKDKWIKIKTLYDNYTGYILNKNFFFDFKPSHKIFVSKANIFIKKKINSKKLIDLFSLPQVYLKKEILKFFYKLKKIDG